MQIVDAQIHTWGSGLPSNLSHRQVTHFTPEEAIALMDEAGVDAAVIHPPGWDPNSTAMALQAVRDYPGRFAVMGALPLERLWAAAEAAGVPVAALATDSLAELGRIAERHPGLRLTIDHLGGRGGLTTLKDDAAMTHMPQLLALARLPNVAVKATGAP